MILDDQRRSVAKTGVAVASVPGKRRCARDLWYERPSKVQFAFLFATYR